MEKELLDTLEASDRLLKSLNRELETLNDNYAKAGLNPKTSQRFLRIKNGVRLLIDKPLLRKDSGFC